MKKVGRIIGNVLVTLVLIFAIFMTVAVLSSTKDDSGLPNLFGKAIFSVETDSMLSEEGFDAGSLIVVELVDHTNDATTVYKVGDVVTFWRYYEDQPYLETHRIVADTYSNQREIVDGVWIHGGTPYYVTKGDNTPDIDMHQNLSIEYATNATIVAKWTGIAIPHLGTVMSFLQSQLGFMLCVVIPTAIFFFFELFKFISTLMEAKKEKAVAAVKDAEEEIKQKVMAEMLAAQEAANAAAPKKADDSAVKAAEEKAKPEPQQEESEEEIKKRAVAEYIAQQEAEKAAAEKAAREEEIKKQAIAEYLAQQEAEKAAEENADNEE